MADSGSIWLPGEHVIPWARCVVTEEELKRRRLQTAERQVCILVAHEEYGQQLLTQYLVPNECLDAFLYELGDAETSEIVGVEWVV